MLFIFQGTMAATGALDKPVYMINATGSKSLVAELPAAATVEYFDTVTNFSFENQSNRIEHVTLCAINPFDRGSEVLGMLSGISRYPMLPISIKCILSPVALEENEELMEKLILSKKDIKLIKQLNMFAVEQLD